MKELISVIIPTYNRASTILRAVESVLNQTYSNIELIVVDDGSTDETNQLLSPYILNRSVTYHKFENSGVAGARNTGAALARGNWLAFLDSDDEWLPHKLTEQMDFLSTHSKLQIVYTDEIWIRNRVLVNKKNHHQKMGGMIFGECLRQCLIAPSSVLLSKNLFDEMKGFDENYVVCEDYDLWLRISSKYEIGFISKMLIKKYGGHSDQLSTRFFAMDSFRIKSMKNILYDKNLSQLHREQIISTIKEKGDILIKGYLKHENIEAAEDIKKILSDVINSKAY
jgi:glycosyltransferase involved in cell wall biosynthesis